MPASPTSQVRVESESRCVEPCNTLFGPYVIWRCAVAALRLLSLSPFLSLSLSLPKAHSNTDCLCNGARYYTCMGD